MKKVFVITGEHSGDIHAGKVVQILKEQNTEIEIHGIGGENLKKAGATIFCDHSKMSGFGLNFKMIIDHIALENDVCEYILDEFKPDLVLLIDYGTFNLRVAKRLKGKGIKYLKGFGSGDIIVTLKGEMPKDIDKNTVKLIKELESSISEKSYPKTNNYKKKLED